MLTTGTLEKLASETRFFRDHLRACPSHRSSLMQTHPATFVAKMARSAEHILLGAEDNILLGISDAALTSLKGKVRGVFKCVCKGG